MARTGAPPMLETQPQVATTILDALRVGNYLETAAAYAGVTPQGVRKWIRRGAAALRRAEQGLPTAQEDRVYMDFVSAVREAEAQAEVRDVSQIAAAARSDWRAAAWRLQHRHPSRWGRSEHRVEHDVAPGAAERGAALLEELRRDEDGRRALERLAERCMEGLADFSGEVDDPGALPEDPPRGGDPAAD